MLPGRRALPRPGQQQGEHREQEVPGDLGGQRPGLPELVEQVARPVDLGQGRGHAQQTGVHLVTVQRQGDEGQHHPVRRQDAQRAPPEVAADGGAGCAEQVAPGERVVEQEARQDEEQRDADLGAREQAAEDAGKGAPGLVADMTHQHE
jgi:hypothetical protein